MERQHNISDKKWVSYGQSKLALLIIVCFLIFHIRFFISLPPSNNLGANGGSTISLDNAKKLVDNYSTKRFRNGSKGVMLSKRAIDLMFPAGSTDNCIVMYPAADITGTDSTLRLIVEPYTTRDANITTTVQSKIFKTEALCPNECGSVGN